MHILFSSTIPEFVLFDVNWLVCVSCKSLMVDFHTCLVLKQLCLCVQSTVCVYKSSFETNVSRLMMQNTHMLKLAKFTKCRYRNLSMPQGRQLGNEKYVEWHTLQKILQSEEFWTEYIIETFIQIHLFLQYLRFSKDVAEVSSCPGCCAGLTGK